MSRMEDATARIANRVRGVTAELRVSQEAVAAVLGLSRQAVNARFNGKVPFQATELLLLASHFDVPVSRFFPEQVAA